MENKDEKDPILSEIQRLDKNIKRILWIGAPVLLLLPIIAIILDRFFDFTNNAPLGDTLGGLTAPIIGVISAMLIYFSFRAQINANRIIQQQITDQKLEENAKREFNYQMELCRHIEVIIDNYECLDRSNSTAEYFYKGNEALDVLLRNLSYKYQRLFNLGSDYHRFIHNVLNQFDSILVLS